MSMELKKAIDQISKDKGLDREMLISTMKDAVRTSVERKYGDGLDIEVSFDENTGDINVFQFKIVVDDPADDSTQISLEDARKHDSSVQLDDEVGFRLRVEDLGRIAAQSAKQVIIQRMRDAEQGIIYEEYKERKGELVSGIVLRRDLRRDKTGWVINLGRTEAILPKDEQIPREHFKRGDRVQAIITDVREAGPGPQVVVSRSHPGYMIALFRREVPEVDDGTIQIFGVARDPGRRAKVAVMSKDRDVDPVGACVGIRGSRIQNVVQELRGERIDIVIWSQDIATYASNALSPALISRIIVDEEENVLEVIVPDEQLNNAIGRDGQNVKLAAKLLGWKIEIFTESRYNEANAIEHGLEHLARVADVPLENFVNAHITTLNAINNTSNEDLSAALGISAEKVLDMRSAFNLFRDKDEPDAGKSLPEDGAEQTGLVEPDGEGGNNAASG
jgi:N utilization substance protein A